jgi:hypothetical protein
MGNETKEAMDIRLCSKTGRPAPTAIKLQPPLLYLVDARFTRKPAIFRKVVELIEGNLRLKSAGDLLAARFRSIAFAPFLVLPQPISLDKFAQFLYSLAGVAPSVWVGISCHSGT